jgi:hypothetical protein
MVTGASVVLAAAILLYRATTTGMWCDELLFLHAIDLGPVAGLWAGESSHPPLLRWLLAPLAGFSAPDWLLRLPSILASAACVVVWSRILLRMFSCRAIVLMLVPVLALNHAFLLVGYQCVPYALLTLFASLHCLAWFRLLENPCRRTAWEFVVSGALSVWTHFYGFNLLVADQLIWALLLIGRRAPRREWFTTTLAVSVLSLPVVPLAVYHSQIVGTFMVQWISRYAECFFLASEWIFGHATFFGKIFLPPLWVLWYLVAATLVFKAWRREHHPSGPGSSSATGDTRVGPLAVAAIACGLFLAGFPAMQLHSLISGREMWERYTVIGAWLHLPMLTLLACWMGGPKVGRTLAGGWLCLALFALARVDPLEAKTSDYGPVVARIRERSRPGDAFLAQDVDIWAGPGNFDRLWFNRYVRADMPVLTGPVMPRAEIYEAGLPLDTAGPSVDRIWVYSHLYQERWLRIMPTHGWRLEELHALDGKTPLALFVRERPPFAESRVVRHEH